VFPAAQCCSGPCCPHKQSRRVQVIERNHTESVHSEAGRDDVRLQQAPLAWPVVCRVLSRACLPCWGPPGAADLWTARRCCRSTRCSTRRPSGRSAGRRAGTLGRRAPTTAGAPRLGPSWPTSVVAEEQLPCTHGAQRQPWVCVSVSAGCLAAALSTGLTCRTTRCARE